MGSVWFWLFVALVVLFLIWIALSRYSSEAPAGSSISGGSGKRKPLPPDSSGTNVHPPRDADSGSSMGRDPGVSTLISRDTTDAKKSEPSVRTAPKPTPQPKPEAEKKPEPAPQPKPAAKVKPKPKPKPASAKDELQRISGIGPKIDGQLKAMKVTTFAQIAAWKKADIDKVNEQLKFKGRIEREGWVPQAKLLAAGKETEFARKYGSGGMKDSSGKTKSGSRTRKA